MQLSHPNAPSMKNNTPTPSPHQPHTSTQYNTKLSPTPQRQSPNAKRNCRRNNKHKHDPNGPTVTTHSILIAQLITARSLDKKPPNRIIPTAKHTRIQPKPEIHKQHNPNKEHPHTSPHNTTTNRLTGNMQEHIIPTSHKKAHLPLLPKETASRRESGANST